MVCWGGEQRSLWETCWRLMMTKSIDPCWQEDNQSSSTACQECCSFVCSYGCLVSGGCKISFDDRNMCQGALVAMAMVMVRCHSLLYFSALSMVASMVTSVLHHRDSWECWRERELATELVSLIFPWHGGVASSGVGARDVGAHGQSGHHGGHNHLQNPMWKLHRTQYSKVFSVFSLLVKRVDLWYRYCFNFLL